MTGVRRRVSSGVGLAICGRRLSLRLCGAVQAFGAEIFLQDMGNSAAMLGLLLLWITMNVLMLNLLIAIMSNTYAKMQEESTRQHLMDLHRLVREYSRRSLAAPPPTNVLFLAADAFWYWRNRSAAPTASQVQRVAPSRSELL